MYNILLLISSFPIKKLVALYKPAVCRKRNDAYTLPRREHIKHILPVLLIEVERLHFTTSRLVWAQIQDRRSNNKTALESKFWHGFIFNYVSVFFYFFIFYFCHCFES